METKSVIDLGKYRRRRTAQDRVDHPVKVLREVDKENANRSYYFVLGEEEAAVQSAVDGLIAEVEAFGSGYGEFTRPRRHDGLFFAFGEVVVRPDVFTEFWK